MCSHISQTWRYTRTLRQRHHHHQSVAVDNATAGAVHCYSDDDEVSWPLNSVMSANMIDGQLLSLCFRASVCTSAAAAETSCQGRSVGKDSPSQNRHMHVPTYEHIHPPYQAPRKFLAVSKQRWLFCLTLVPWSTQAVLWLLAFDSKCYCRRQRLNSLPFRIEMF